VIGLPDAPRPVSQTDIDHLAGTWSREEADAFDRYMRSSRQIEPTIRP
jgi:hypothetical protein